MNKKRPDLLFTLLVMLGISIAVTSYAASI